MILRKNRFITAIFLLAVFSFGFSLYAEDDIELPDLTTVVSADKEEEENIPAPDFTDLIQLPETAGKLVPELPEVAPCRRSPDQQA